MQISEDESLRDDIATILEIIAKDGLPGPRDLDVALDAIIASVQSTIDLYSSDQRMERSLYD